MDLIDVPGIGEKTASVLRQHEIDSVEQLLTYYPRTYREFHARTTKTVSPGEWVSLVGSLTRPVSRHTSRVSTQVSTFRDVDGSLTLRWFNSPFVTRSLSPAQTYFVRGQVTVFADRYQLVNPELKPVPTIDYHPPTIELVPIYTPLGSLKSGHLRNHIKSALEFVATIPDPHTLEIQSKYSLLDLPTAISHIHFPQTKQDLEEAIHRLAFDELYALQRESLYNRELTQTKTDPLHWDTGILENWITGLPYTPTSSQRHAIAEIAADLARPVSMHRLLQGEVGSGKTLVAAASALLTHAATRQTLLLAPTQILAEQLFASFTRLLPQLSVSLVTQNVKGDTLADVVIGTQSLLSPKNSFGKVGLVIVDEQHRFGVEQRLLLTRFTPAPHFLQMTATPIPRTLALTLFTNLDISYLTDLPPGRLPTKTYFVTPAKRRDAYSWVSHEVTAGNQAFVVVPLIERALDQEENPRASLHELELELKSLFPHLVIDIMHGQQKSDDKTARLRAFRDGRTQILVATSMVEVGIDIPGANLMVIEDAERFGLAQLHQLRGRVGRGGEQGHCLVLTRNPTTKVKDRLAYFVAHHDGEALARYDLESRGPGELYGTTQHGFFSLRFANLSDETLLRQTAEAAKITPI